MMELNLMLAGLFVLLLLLCAGPTWALSADRVLAWATSQEKREGPLAAGAKVYKGGFVGKNPAGYLKAFVPGDEFVGVAWGTYDNSSGLDGGLYATYTTTGDVQHTLTSAALKDVGKPVFATADDALALTGHPDAYVGRIVNYMATNTVLVRLKCPGDAPPNGQGSITLQITGHENFAATGATAGTTSVNGFDLKSILGLGWTCNDAEDAGIIGDLDATAEVALLSCRSRNDCLPVDKGLTFDVDLVVSDKADAAAVDVDFGFGTALTTNSEANVDHADMVQLAAFHLDGNSDNILAQSDDNTTDVAAVDTTIDNDSTTDVPKHFKIVVRPTGAVEFWIDGARVLASTTFTLLSTAVVAAFINAEKTSDDTTFQIMFRNLAVKAGAAA